jgi:PKD repeat protein
MRIKTPRFSKLALSIFVAVFALSFISLSGSNGFLKPSVAGAADPALGPAADNPGIKKAIEVQGRHSESLMGIPGVVGHGIGVSSDGEPVIKIFAERAGIPGIPAALEGVPTKVEVTGMVVAYINPAAKFPRPVSIGVSTGHPDITAGTIGCRVTDGTYVYALSNNHVYANQNNASIGDNVLQPGPYDGGQDPEDAIGTLFDYVAIDFSGGDNTVDAAIALTSAADLGISTPGVPGLDGYGTPSSSIAGAYVGQGVQKNGRTTGWTHGEVDLISATVDVCYETRGFIFQRCVKAALFVGQIGITPGTFSAGGDSGSLIVTEVGNNPVGLLFAGGGNYTFANPIGAVLESFSVSVDDGNSSGNITPTSDFTYAANGLTVDFTDQSTDSDGSIESWSWDFGDGSTSTAQNPSHTYEADGTYTVTLTVTDDVGGTDSASKDITVSGESGGVILTATGYKVKGRHNIDLTWTGATSTDVKIYRDGVLIATTLNDGDYTDSTNNVGGGSYTYQVCEAGNQETCSNEATVTF